MSWSKTDVETVCVCVLLTALAAFFTLLLSVCFGSAIAFRARPTRAYGAKLALLFVPYAIGASVWAYAMMNIVGWLGLQGSIVGGGIWGRATLTLMLCLARAVPLGVFFWATSLQRFTAEIRAYFQTHRLGLPFYILCALNRVPKSMLTLLGLFGGAMMATDAAIPTFLYRANPGTPPETANIMLSRLFREMYSQAGPNSMPRLALLGLVVSALLLGAATASTIAGKAALEQLQSRLRNSVSFRSAWIRTFAWCARAGAIACLLPGIVALCGLTLTTGNRSGTPGGVARAFNYGSIVNLGLIVGLTITIVGVAAAVRLRYGSVNRLRWLETKPLAAALLLLPAFLPILTVVALLGSFTQNRDAWALAYLPLFASHVALHYPLFQYIIISLIASIPERHVSWQQTMRMNYWFSLITDGFKRHGAVLASLLGLATVQVVTDGSISRWFSHLVAAPEEALNAAVFGRVSNSSDAVMIAWTVGLIATIVCSVLAATYVRELASRPRYA